MALILACFVTAGPVAQRGSLNSAVRQDSGQAGMDLTRLDAIPPLVEQAIADKKLPGAVSSAAAIASCIRRRSGVAP
jgi:hypothetical protein